jgi:hypothetical protein
VFRSNIQFQNDCQMNLVQMKKYKDLFFILCVMFKNLFFNVKKPHFIKNEVVNELIEKVLKNFLIYDSVFIG